MQPRPRTPSESPLDVRVRPGVSIGTRNALTPRPRMPGCVAANTMHDVGGLGVGDPDLAAGERRSRARRAARRSAGWRRRSRRAPPTARTRRATSPDASRRSHGLLLRVGPELRERLGDERVVHRGDHRDHRAGARQRLDGQRVADVVAARAAPLRRDGHAHQAQLRRRARSARAGTSPLSSIAGACGATAAPRTRHLLLKGVLLVGEFEDASREIVVAATCSASEVRTQLFRSLRWLRAFERLRARRRSPVSAVRASRSKIGRSRRR